MSDNVIKSTDVTSAKKEKNPVKKTAVKKEPIEVKVGEELENKIPGFKVVIFETGSSYVSGDTRFTREDNIKEVSNDEADFLLTLDNFRVPNQLELEDYFNSKED